MHGISTEEPSCGSPGAIRWEEGRAGASREVDGGTTAGKCSKSRSSKWKGAPVVVNREAAERDCAESGAGSLGEVIGLCHGRESAEPDMLRAVSTLSNSRYIVEVNEPSMKI